MIFARRVLLWLLVAAAVVLGVLILSDRPEPRVWNPNVTLYQGETG